MNNQSTIVTSTPEDNFEELNEEKKIREAKIRDAAPEILELIKSIVDYGLMRNNDYTTAKSILDRLS